MARVRGKGASASADGDTPVSGDRVIDTRGVETIVELLRRVAEAYPSERALALYMGVSSAVLNKWTNGKGTPNAQSCWKIADLITQNVRHMPTLLWVMQLAGHLPPDAPVASPDGVTLGAGLPDWVRLLPRLTPADTMIVARMVETMARSPLVPA